jgi:hypothetical protein
MDDKRQLWTTVHERQTTVYERQFMNDGSWMMNNSYERWLMDDEQQLWMTVTDGGRQFMDDGGWTIDDG